MEEMLTAKVTGTGTELYDLFMTPENIGIVLSIPLLIGFMKRIFPKAAQTPLAKRLLPGAPLFWAEVAMFVPGLQPEGWELGPRLMLGLFLGAMSLKSHVILRKVGLESLADVLSWNEHRKETKALKEAE